jgi:hypothetical protein
MRPRCRGAMVNTAHILKEINGRLANWGAIRFKLPKIQLLTRFFAKRLARRFRSAAEAFCTTDMRCRRQDLNVGQQSLIRGSSRMTLFRLGLPLSR